MRNVSRKEDVGARPAFYTRITILEKKFTLYNIERFVFSVMNMARRPAFRLGNTFEDYQTSSRLLACNDGSYLVAIDVQGGIRPRLVAHRHHKLPQRCRTWSCHRSNIPLIVYQCNYS